MRSPISRGESCLRPQPPESSWPSDFKSWTCDHYEHTPITAHTRSPPPDCQRSTATPRLRDRRSCRPTRRPCTEPTTNLSRSRLAPVANLLNLSRSLYRRALKLSLDWAVHRSVWRGQALYIRSLFEANRNVADPRQKRVRVYSRKSSPSRREANACERLSFPRPRSSSMNGSTPSLTSRRARRAVR